MTHQTTYVPKQTNHLLHLALTVLTCGAWAFVWLPVAIWNASTKHKHTTVTSGYQDRLRCTECRFWTYFGPAMMQHREVHRVGEQ